LYRSKAYSFSEKILNALSDTEFNEVVNHFYCGDIPIVNKGVNPSFSHFKPFFFLLSDFFATFAVHF
jgi:hypothetical protein